MASQEDIYEQLWAYRVPQNELESWEYPIRDPENPSMRLAPKDHMGRRKPLEQEFAREYKCERCKSNFRVGEDGVARERDTCCYHSAPFDKRFPGRWLCCDRLAESAQGCVTATHAHKGEFLIQNFKGYVTTEAKDDLEPNKHGVFALDCEMVDTAYGRELARLSVLDYKGRVVMDHLVMPTNSIINYNTSISGLDADVMDDVTTTLADVQDQLRSTFSSKTILVGHSLANDMKALKLFHTTFVDTVQLYRHPKGKPYTMALRRLKEDHLGVGTNYKIAHDSAGDALYALKLAYRKARISQPMAK